MFYAPNAPVPVIELISPNGIYNHQFEAYLNKLAPLYESIQQHLRDERAAATAKEQQPQSSATITRNTDSDRTESEEEDVGSRCVDDDEQDEMPLIRSPSSDLEHRCPSGEASDDDDDEEEEKALDEGAEQRSENYSDGSPQTDGLANEEAELEARDGMESPAAESRPMHDEEETMAHKAKRLSVIQSVPVELEDHPFNVLTVVGDNQSGVSRLLNHMFNCSFPARALDVNNDDTENEENDLPPENKRTSQDPEQEQEQETPPLPRTTQGMWAAKVRNHGGRHLVLMDIGHFDGDLAKQARLWDQSITFALAVSDAIGISCYAHEIDMYPTNELPAWMIDRLRHIVTVQTNLQYMRDRVLPKARCILYFFVRDWNFEEHDADNMETEVIRDIMETVWTSVDLPPHLKDLDYDEFYEPNVIPVPSLLRPNSRQAIEFAQEAPKRIFGDMPTAYSGDVSICEFAPFCEQVWQEVSNRTPAPLWQQAGDLLMMARCVVLKERIAYELVERIRAEHYPDFNAYWDKCHPRRMVRVAYGEFRLYSSGYPARVTKPVAYTLYEAVCAAYDPIVQENTRRLVKTILDKILYLRRKMAARSRIPQSLIVSNRARMLRNFDTFIDGTDMNVVLEDGTRVKYNFYLREMRQWLARTIDEIFTQPLSLNIESSPSPPDFAQASNDAALASSGNRYGPGTKSPSRFEIQIVSSTRLQATNDRPE